MKLVAGATPLHRLTRIEEATRCGPLWVKRDDLTGFGLSGSKARSLEHIVAEAAANGATAFVTGGGAQSDFVGAAALACAAIAMPCHVVVADYEDTLAMRLAVAAGAQLTAADSEDLQDAIVAQAADLESRGAQAFIASPGGGSALGAQGFADAVKELGQQLKAARVVPERVVVAVETGATLAGVCVGGGEIGASWATYGVCVTHSTGVMSERIDALIGQCNELRGSRKTPHVPVLRDATYPRGSLDREEQAAADLAFHLEGLFLDTAYTAKTFAASLRMALSEPGPTVFWHTGGMASALINLPATPN